MGMGNRLIDQMDAEEALCWFEQERSKRNAEPIHPIDKEVSSNQPQKAETKQGETLPF